MSLHKHDIKLATKMHNQWQEYQDELKASGEDYLIECGCGFQFMIERRAFTNTCPMCDRDYDGNGDRLADRSQWGEETGETVTEILTGGEHD